MSRHTVGVYMQETFTLRFCLCPDMQLVCICRKLSHLGFAYVPTYSWCVYAGNFPTLRFCLCHDMQLVCICRKLSYTEVLLMSRHTVGVYMQET